VPQTDVLRLYEGFVASFDLRTRNPKWVLEFISRDMLRGEGTRRVRACMCACVRACVCTGRQHHAAHLCLA
jgi:hypothetical protein